VIGRSETYQAAVRLRCGPCRRREDFGLVSADWQSVTLDDAIASLAARDEVQAKIVELQFFGELLFWHDPLRTRLTRAESRAQSAMSPSTYPVVATAARLTSATASGGMPRLRGTKQHCQVADL
jgi:hypothetical protein